MLGVCFTRALSILERAGSSTGSGVSRLASRLVVSLHYLDGYPMQQLESIRVYALLPGGTDTPMGRAVAATP